MTKPTQHSFRLTTVEAEARFRAFLAFRSREKRAGTYHGPSTAQDVIVAALDAYFEANPGWESDYRHELRQLRKAGVR